MLLKNIFRIIANVRYVGPIAWAGLVSMIGMELIILVLPKLAERVVHSLEIRAPYETALWWCYALAGMSALYIAVSAVRHRITDYAWGRVFVEKTLEYKKGLLAINYATLLKYGTGKLISRFSRGIDAETDFMYRALDMLVAGTLRLVVVMVIIGFYSPWLALGFLAFLILNGAIQLKVSGYFAPLAQELEETFEEDKRNLARIATENFLIRTSNRADYETARAGEILNGYPLKNVRYEAGAWGIFYLLELGFRWMEALAFAWLGWYVLGGTLPLSTIPMVGTYVWLAWDPIANFLTHLRAMSRGYESYLKMRQVLDAPEVYSDGTQQYRYEAGELELREVTFGYAESITVLDGLSLRIEGGKTTALVGHSGSGKSTVMKLLLRIYDPSSGEIDYDGQNLRTLSLESVYSRIGYLPQEPAIFDGTVRENLAYATTEREFSDHELWQALADARLDERIRQFETGLDTEIGERGVKLSGGERQRLAIARIFLKNPDIILLDEPTSALDSISEKIIADLLVSLSHGKTVVIIAHRLQTVMHADTIYVMDHGHIKERGTHAELLAAGGTYAELVDLQTGTLRE